MTRSCPIPFQQSMNWNAALLVLGLTALLVTLFNRGTLTATSATVLGVPQGLPHDVVAQPSSSKQAVVLVPPARRMGLEKRTPTSAGDSTLSPTPSTRPVQPTPEGASFGSLTSRLAANPKLQNLVHVQRSPHPDTKQRLVTVSVPIVVATNPDRCGVQPNTTQIDPYKGCPLPGLNNLLYSQTNRWYCAFEQGFTAHLRDRTCDKGSVTPFRFSTILTIDQERADELKKQEEQQKHLSKSDKPATKLGAVCWSDIPRQIEPPKCGWGEIPFFYGRPKWWVARSLIDFHAVYYAAAAEFVLHFFNNEPFIAVHLRRGDYFTHCVKVLSKRTPAWVSFATDLIPSLADLNPKRSAAKKIDHNGNLHSVHSNCFPTKMEVEEHLQRIRSETSIKHVFLATNHPDEFSDVAEKLGIRTFSIKGKDGFTLQTARKMDALIVEMAVASMASFFVFNRYSSLSGSIFEMATIHNRTLRELQKTVAGGAGATAEVGEGSPVKSSSILSRVEAGEVGPSGSGRYVNVVTW